MTTVAQSIVNYDLLETNLHKIYVMGGYWTKERIIYGTGSLELPYEGDYNLTSDPEASMILLQSGIDTLLVPPNVTLETFFNPDDISDFKNIGKVQH